MDDKNLENNSENGENKPKWSPAQGSGGQKSGSQETPASDLPPELQDVPNVQNMETHYLRGCVGAAWEDIKLTRGWISKVLLMALIEYVPILNWVNKGYAMRWGRQLIFEKLEPMPQQIFCNRAFVNGAMAYLIELLVAILTWLVTLVVGFIPLLGFLLGIAAGVVISMFYNIMNIRMAIFDDLGEAFSLNSIIKSSKGHFGEMFLIAFIPSFLTGLIALGIGLLILAIGCMVAGGSVISLTREMMTYSGQYSFYMQDPQILAGIILEILKVGIMFVPFLLILVFGINFCSVLSHLITVRAAGHFAARYCQDWKTEPKFAIIKQE